MSSPQSVHASVWCHMMHAGNPDATFEISPLTSYEGEDLVPLVANRTFTVPFELVAPQQ